MTSPSTKRSAYTHLSLSINWLVTSTMRRALTLWWQESSGSRWWHTLEGKGSSLEFSKSLTTTFSTLSIRTRSQWAAYVPAWTLSSSLLLVCPLMGRRSCLCLKESRWLWPMRIFSQYWQRHWALTSKFTEHITKIMFSSQCLTNQLRKRYMPNWKRKEYRILENFS